MPKITIDLSEAGLAKLKLVAEEKLRGPEAQARVIIEEVMGTWTEKRTTAPKAQVARDRRQSAQTNGVAGGEA
jgi:hypothetical protein